MNFKISEYPFFLNGDELVPCTNQNRISHLGFSIEDGIVKDGDENLFASRILPIGGYEIIDGEIKLTVKPKNFATTFYVRLDVREEVILAIKKNGNIFLVWEFPSPEKGKSISFLYEPETKEMKKCTLKKRLLTHKERGGGIEMVEEETVIFNAVESTFKFDGIAEEKESRLPEGLVNITANLFLYKGDSEIETAYIIEDVRVKNDGQLWGVVIDALKAKGIGYKDQCLYIRLHKDFVIGATKEGEMVSINVFNVESKTLKEKVLTVTFNVFQLSRGNAVLNAIESSNSEYIQFERIAKDGLHLIKEHVVFVKEETANVSMLMKNVHTGKEKSFFTVCSKFDEKLAQVPIYKKFLSGETVTPEEILNDEMLFKLAREDAAMREGIKYFIVETMKTFSRVK